MAAIGSVTGGLRGLLNSIDNKSKPADRRNPNKRRKVKRGVPTTPRQKVKRRAVSGRTSTTNKVAS